MILIRLLLIKMGLFYFSGIALSGMISLLTDFINRINMISEDSYVGQAPTIHFNKIGEDYEDIEEISSCVDDNAFEIFIERNISFTVNNNEVTEKGFFNKIFEEEGKENEKKDSIL